LFRQAVVNYCNAGAEKLIFVLNGQRIFYFEQRIKAISPVYYLHEFPYTNFFPGVVFSAVIKTD